MTQSTQITNQIIPPGSNPLQLTISPLPQSSQAATNTTSSGTQFLNGGDAPSFKDVLDTINPLQHIPIISTIYQKLTGDIPSSAASIAGGALFGGPMGVASAVFNSMVQQQTGTDIAGNILDAIEGKQVPMMQTASNDTSPTANMNFHQKNSYNAYVQANALV